MVEYDNIGVSLDETWRIIDSFKDEDFDSRFSKETNDLMYNWEAKTGTVKKDLFTGDVLKVVNLDPIDKDKISVLLDCGMNMIVSLKKEKKFFDLNELGFENSEDLMSWLDSDDCKNWLNENDIKFKVEVTNFNVSGSLLEAFLDDIRLEFIDQLKKQSYVYRALVKSKNKGGFIVNVSGLDAFLPGGLASTNKIENFDTLIGKEVPVMIEDYLYDSDVFVVSNKKYVAKILPEKIKELEYTKTYEGNVTGTTNYGIFVEFNEIFTGLLHQSEMDSETLEKFNSGKFKIDSKINFYIKKIDNPYRIILTQNIEDSVKRLSFDDFKLLNEGKWMIGEVSNLCSYGTFIKFTVEENNFIGLLHYKSYQEN